MERNMTSGSPLRLLLAFSLPLFLGNLFQQIYSMVDTVVVGRFVGVDALAALGAVGGFSFMCVGFAQGLGCGFAVLVSQCYGAGDHDRMRKAYAMSIVASIVVGIVVSLLFFAFSMPMLELVRTPSNIISMANDYISIIYIGLLASVFYNLFSSILRAVGDSRSPLLFLLISSVLNVVLDLFLVLVIPMGCAGVAIATILSQAISAVISYFYIAGKFPIFRFRKGDFRLDFNMIRILLKIGLPGAIQFSVCAIGVIIVQIAINGFGSDIVAAYSIGNKIETLLSQMFTALGMAISTYAGQNLGAGNLDRITQVEYVDQNPIGKSSRSNAVTYLKIYDDIRKLLSEQQFAKLNGFTPSFFSFNMDGGRCPECQGEGFVKIGMQFMADVKMVCEACGGKRFKPEILEVKYKGKNIDDILNMSVEEAIGFFGGQADPAARRIAERLQPLVDVGLSYIKLGQSSSTLSGGESQRIKLAYFLSMNDSQSGSGRIMFIFDEPTTGLHFYDVEKLLKSFDALLDKGHTIVVVEHNPDVIRSADWVVDLGPEAGDAGGRIVFEGTPEDLVSQGSTWTARYLADPIRQLQ